MTAPFHQPAVGNASCIPMQDGTWIAHDPLTRLSASGRTKAEAINALVRLVSARSR